MSQEQQVFCKLGKPSEGESTMTTDEMKAQAEQQQALAKKFARLSEEFGAEIIRQIEANVGKGGTYVPSVDALKAAAFPAFKEIADSEGEGMTPMMAVLVWESALKINESAFRQGLVKMEKAKLLGFSIQKTAEKDAGAAMKWLQS